MPVRGVQTSGRVGLGGGTVAVVHAVTPVGKGGGAGTDERPSTDGPAREKKNPGSKGRSGIVAGETVVWVNFEKNACSKTPPCRKLISPKAAKKGRCWSKEGASIEL